MKALNERLVRLLFTRAYPEPDALFYTDVYSRVSERLYRNLVSALYASKLAVLDAPLERVRS